MDMGKRIRQARLESGLSQSQLSADLISRNMLSLIESGSAKPSLGTLEELARRLQKPIGYFFGEDSESLSGRSLVEEAWKAYNLGHGAEAARILNSRRDLDKFSDVPLLRAMVLLQLSRQAIEEKRIPYARELLQWAAQEAKNFEAVRREVLLLQGSLEGQRADLLCRELPSMDEELLLRAKAALEQRNPERASRLLEAAENVKNPEWAMLRGRAYLLQGHFKSAARCFHQAEQACPKETSAYLEQCYRELGDFKQAYYYACRQK